MVSPYYEASYISIHRQSKGFPRISSLLLRPSRALGFTEPSSIQVLTSKSTSVITALHSTPFSPDSVGLVCLTDCTASHILLYEFLHLGPPVVLGNGKKGAGYPWMTRSGCIVVLLGYLPPKVIVFHNNEMSRMPPVMIM